MNTDSNKPRIVTREQIANHKRWGFTLKDVVDGKVVIDCYSNGGSGGYSLRRVDTGEFIPTPAQSQEDKAAYNSWYEDRQNYERWVNGDLEADSEAAISYIERRGEGLISSIEYVISEREKSKKMKTLRGKIKNWLEEREYH